MRNKTLVDEFTDLVDGYKVDKITKLINGDSASKNPSIKKGIKGFLNDLNTKNKEKFETYYSSALDPVNLSSVKKLLAGIYSFDFSNDFNEWMEYQNSEEYKSQSLRVKIANKVKKAISDQETKDQVKKILNEYKLDYDLGSALETITKNISGESLQKIEDQKDSWFTRLSEINDEFEYANWLDDKSSKAKDVGFATHIAKLTHSGISGASNVFFNEKGNKSYLSTGSLLNKDVEVSQTNNLLAPIGKLLQLHCNNESLSEQLKKGNLAIFEAFAKNDEQLAQWRKGFEAVFKEKSLASHYLAKQMYFPINDNDHYDDKNYHLINPMMSSSLDQVIFEKINFFKPKFSKKAVEIGKQKRERKYHQDIQLSFPKLAILKVTASNHGNAGSPLNGKRTGQRYLLPSHLCPPLGKKYHRRHSNKNHFLRGNLKNNLGDQLKNYRGILSNCKTKNLVIKPFVTKLSSRLITSLIFCLIMF